MACGNKFLGTYVLGLAHEYAPSAFGPEDFEDVVQKLYPNYASLPGLQKLLHLNRKTQIQSRRTIYTQAEWSKWDATPPTINQLSRIFRTRGVDLAATACQKALQEANVAASDITHTVAVTCTDQGNPGYDLFVCQKLELRPNVQRTLLHGVGCAGGLSALRAAADITVSETQRQRPARVLVMACELCSLFFRAELQAASRDNGLHIAPTLFSDAAAAVVVSNGIGLGGDHKPIFDLQEWGSMVVPGTLHQMSYDIESNGMLANITKDVPQTAIKAISPMYQQLIDSERAKQNNTKLPTSVPSDYDWAIHPGGASILQGAQQAIKLTDDHIRASLKVYQTCGNTSSPTVLIVLDKLRRMGRGRDQVIATSFGPGIMIEMFTMRRCRDEEPVVPVAPQINRRTQVWSRLRSKLVKILEQPWSPHKLRRVDSGVGGTLH